MKKNMFWHCFGSSIKQKQKQEPKSLTRTLSKLNEKLEILQRDEQLLLKKVETEAARAKELVKSKDKKGALQCLKRKKSYEKQIEQYANYQLRIHDQMITLEGAQATSDTFTALRTGAAAMKSVQGEMHINNVDETMNEINEQTESLKQIHEILSAPIGGADFDEDLDDLELETQPAIITIPAVDRHVPAGEQLARAAPDNGPITRQAEMAI